MKKLLLFVMILGFTTSLFAQQHVIPGKDIRNFAVKKVSPAQQQKIGTKTQSIPSYKSDVLVDEATIGNSYIMTYKLTLAPWIGCICIPMEPWEVFLPLD